MEPTSHRYAAQHHDLHYLAWGDPAASPLILLHGGYDHARSWDRIARAFAADRHVIVPDMRGHGDSDWSPGGDYSVNAHVFDLAALVQLLAAPVAVVAHSFGGRVALRHAGLYPEQVARLVAIEGIWREPEIALPVEQRIRTYHERQRALAAARPRGYPTIEEAAARMSARNPRLAPDLALHLTHHGTRIGDDGRYRWKFDPRVGPVSPIDISHAERDRIWARIACPILLMRGDEGDIADYASDGSLARFADARAATIAGAGHWVQHDRPDDLIAIVTGFLR